MICKDKDSNLFSICGSKKTLFHCEEKWTFVFDNKLFLYKWFTDLQCNERNIPVWPNKMLGCVLHLQFVIDSPEHGGCQIDVAPISGFVVFPLLQHGVRSEIPTGIDKIAAHLRGSCLSVILHWQLQRNHFFFNTQLKLAQKREPLFWQYTVCKWFKCNNKISLFDLIMCSQSGKGEVGMFVLSIHCMKKSPTSKNMILRKGKKIHERWI